MQTYKTDLNKYALHALLVVTLLLGASTATAATTGGGTKNPHIDPADFSTTITNPYFSLPIGLVAKSKGETEDGTETIEISVSGDTKMLMGVKTLIYRDKVWVDGELVEDTEDYLAQDKDGNVWYFGEEVNNYEDGKLKDHHGTWLAGQDGAQPGIWMKASPKVGEQYQQEYFKGEAEDYAKVISVSETVKVPAGTFTNCLQTLDVNPLEDRTTDEYKYYCPQVKGFALETDTKGGERIELVSVTGLTGAVSNSPANIAKMEALIELLKQLIALLIQQKGM